MSMSEGTGETGFTGRAVGQPGGPPVGPVGDHRLALQSFQSQDAVSETGQLELASTETSSPRSRPPVHPTNPNHTTDVDLKLPPVLETTVTFLF